VPPVYVELVARAELGAPAAAAGSTILIQAEEIRKSPENLGMVIHELAHVLQQYPQPAPGWLVEGIADYLRYYLFEPGTNQRFDPHQMDYTVGYWPASAFLDWIQQTYDPQLVPALHRALRSKSYRDELFVARTKKTLQELWQEFLLAPRPEFLTQAQCRAEFFRGPPATAYAAALAREQLGSHSPRAR
jgi:hypothetical protein